MDGKTVLIGAAVATAGFIGYSLIKGQVTRAEQEPLQNTINAYSQGQLSSTIATGGQTPLEWQDVIYNPEKYGITFNAFGIPQIPDEVIARLPALGAGAGILGPGALTGQLSWGEALSSVGRTTALNLGLELSGAKNKPFQTWFNNEILPYYNKYKSEIDPKLHEAEQQHLETLYKVWGTNPFIDHDKLYLADKVMEHKYGNGTIECDGTVTADVAIIDGVKFKVVGGGGERIYDENSLPSGGQWQQGNFKMVGKEAKPWTPTTQMVNPFDDYYQYKSGDIWLESVGLISADKARQVLTLLGQGKIDQAKAVANDSYDTPAALIGKPEVAQAISQIGTYHPGTKAGGYDEYGNLKEWYVNGIWVSTQQLAGSALGSSSVATDYGYSVAGSGSSYTDTPGGGGLHYGR
ncbi:MAG: hypothetical protein GYA60_01565 [Candidatus Methanofastidiosa archaeon]|nr:hypothetical protein [Candidatus Methanofastidiosa archaeon]